MDVEIVIVNGVELSQPAEICEAFRKYISSTFRKDEGNDPKLNYSAISSMQHFAISVEDVHQQLNKRRNTPKNSHQSRRLSGCAFGKVFNNSLDTGIIPVEWKSSIICPIFKKGSKRDVANYRPICLTSVACKILE